MLDDAVLPSRVHGLEYQEESPAVLRVELVLQFCAADNALLQSLSGTFFGPPVSRICGIEVFQPKMFAAFHLIGLRQFVSLHL